MGLGLAALVPLALGLVATRLLYAVRAPAPARVSPRGLAVSGGSAVAPPASSRVPVPPTPEGAPGTAPRRQPPAERAESSTLEGRVIDAATGRPVETFRVFHVRASRRDLLERILKEPSHARLRIAADGGYRLTDLAPGRYGLVIDARPAGYEPLVLEDVVLPRDEPLVARVERGPHVHGRVRTPDGLLLRDHAVELLGPLGGSRAPSLRSTSTDEEARYLFALLEPGWYRLVTAGHEATPAFEVRDRAGVERDLVPALPGSLRVTVEDPRGIRLARPALLLARDGEFRGADPGGHGGPGELLVAGLEPDRYALEVRHEGFRTDLRTVNVHDGVPTELRVVLEPERPGR